MLLHGARNYRKLVADVYNCCGFNPRPFYATSRELAASFTNRAYPLTPITDLSSYIVLYVALCRRKLNGCTEPETSIREMFSVNLVLLYCARTRYQKMLIENAEIVLSLEMLEK